MPEPLRFYDHHRQRYAGKVPIPEAGEFMIGDYTDEGTVGRDGEFKITLIELHGDRRWSLYPHLEVFGEGIGALRRAIDAGLLDVLRPPVNSRDEFTRRLLDIGLIDRSHNPLPEVDRERPAFPISTEFQRDSPTGKPGKDCRQGSEIGSTSRIRRPS